MASSTSSDLKLELITTGEKSGTWGTITNTNLQILEQAASGYLSLAVGGADVALSLANHATANGKNLYFKLTGTLTANRTVTMPDSAERVFIVEDATARSSSNYTLTVKTVSGNRASFTGWIDNSAVFRWYKYYRKTTDKRILHTNDYIHYS
jgi:hypothetical protein